jgi:RHS repeat-associated protein
MPSFPVKFCFFAIFVFGLLCTPTRCQVVTGTPSYGTYSGGPDVVSVSNLNISLGIPILHKSGRMLDFNAQFFYESSVWYPAGASGSQYWTPVKNWGWIDPDAMATGGITSTETTLECHAGHGFELNLHKYSNWTYTDPNGTSHAFGGTSEVFEGGCAGPPPTGFTSTATDGSGYTFTARGASGTATSADGVIITPAWVTDRNGNKISRSLGVYTDTTGSVALTVTPGTGTPPTPTTFSYTAPNGQTVKYTVSYGTYTVRTNFGCSGVADFGPLTEYLVSAVNLPDGTAYEFSYEPTPNYTGDVTGALASIKLPTGGTITYVYSEGFNRINCTDGSGTALIRQATPGYTSSYIRTGSQTVITSPLGDQTSVTFTNGSAAVAGYEVSRQVYSGASGSGNLLETVSTCYNGAAPPCTTIQLPITQRSVYVQWPGTNGLESRSDVFFNSYGAVTERDEYGYGAGAPGPIIRKKLASYATLGNGIVDRPATTTVEDGNGNIIAQTSYLYDQSPVVATSSTPQHVSISGSRGNATTVSYWISASRSLAKTFTFFDTGNVQTATDINSAQTTYAYGACGNSYLTSVLEPLNLSKSSAWNCNGGVLTSITDESGATVNSNYTSDPYFWRPTSITDETSNVTSFAYAGQTSIESVVPVVSGSSATDILVSTDSLGRAQLSQVRQSPSSSTFDTIETDYDGLGRISKTSLPFAGNAGQTNSSAAGTTKTYDPLNRTIELMDSGGRTVGFTYNQNDAYVSITPVPTGELAKRRQLEFDGLGRLTSVCELTAAVGSGTCGQTAPAVGYWTTYSYNVLDQVTGVVQSAQAAGPQTRSYFYDGLGRMTQEQNPESGTTVYAYDTDTTCGSTYNGDLVKKIDQAQNVTCYSYDALHRLLSTTVISGPYASTAAAHFVYDSATVDGASMLNSKPRMVEAYTCTSSCATKITDIGLSYDARGRVTDVYESTPHSSGYYHISSAFWPNGVAKTLTGLPGLPTISYNLDGEGRVRSVSASSGQNPLSSTLYNPAGLPTAINLGSSDSDSFVYDPSTNRMTNYTFTVNGQSVVGTPTWNPNGSLKSLAITDAFNSAENQTCAYSHDDLARLSSVNCGSLWSQTFSYDAFGNIEKSGTQSFQATYSSATNHMTEIGSQTPTYDLNGNVTNDFLHAYSWDAYGKPVTIDSIGIMYDALGRMAEQNKSGVYSELVYAPTGAKLGIMSGQVIQKAYVKLTGGSVAVFNSSGLSYYRHSDWVGSSRLSSTPARAVYADAAYGPFGEPYAQSGASDLSYTGMNQDTVPNLYDFPQREYGVQGRWPSPDPSGISSARVSDPQSWDRYAYARNDPVRFVDQDGTCTAPVGGNGVCIDLFIPTAYVPGTDGTGLGDNRGPDGDGGSFRVQFQVTYDPSAGIATVLSETGASQADILGVVLTKDGTLTALPSPNMPSGVNGQYGADGSVTVTISAAALNGLADVPFSTLFGDVTQPIEISISVTINADGTASVNSGSAFSGYPSLEVWNYQNGQDPVLLDYVPAGTISQLGTDSTPIPPAPTPGGDDITDDNSIDTPPYEDGTDPVRGEQAPYGTADGGVPI